MTQTKQCRRCQTEKPASEFYKDSKNKTDGLSSYCKTCNRAAPVPSPAAIGASGRAGYEERETMTTEANRMAQLIRLAVNENQRVTRSIIWVNTARAFEQKDEPTFWVNELGRYVGFEEMDYDPTVQRWYLSA